MKNIRLILLLQFVVFSVCAQDKPLLSSINSRIVNKEGVVQHVTFNANEELNFTDGTHVLKQFLETSDQITFVQLKSEVDNIGMKHETYQQYYNGIPVEFAIYKVHSKNQKLTSINGEFYPIENINTTPLISAFEAVSKAKQLINAEKFVEDLDVFYYENMDYNGPMPTLVILPKTERVSTTNRLAYKLDIYAEKPLYRADLYLDAQTGAIIFENSKIQHADETVMGMTLYNGQQTFKAELTGGTYRLRQTTSGNGIQTFEMNNAIGYANGQDITSVTNNFNSNQDAVQVHWGTEQTYNYYFQRHGRNSFDDNGTILKSYVNYGNMNFPNKAFWNGSVMTYNGFPTSTFNELVAIDIVGHEITHGVVQHSAGLIYSYQSGALNESFADIFGEMTENFAQQGVNDWLAGNAVHIDPNEAFRSMSNPKSKNHPDTYLGQHWHTSPSDRFGVHTNSGVQNKWFYLLSEGGTGTNDNNDSYTVTGIGKILAAEIAYRNLTVYLTPTSNFFDARVGAIQSAIDIHGLGAPEVIATTQAWDAVGVGVASTDTIPPTTPLNLVGSNFTQYNIDLTWDASTDNIGVMGYNVYNGTTLIGTTTSTNYSNGNLTMPINMTHDFTVSAFDAAGNISGLSNVETFWIDTIDPSNPTNLTSTNTTQTTADLSWDAATDNFTVTGYKVYLNSTYLVTVSNTSYNATNLSPGSMNNFRVRAIDDSGNESGFSNVETVTTLLPCSASGNFILTIFLDFMPQHTSWDIRDNTNTIVASGGGYSFADVYAIKTYNIPLTAGEHTLNVYDTAGDGINGGGYIFESDMVYYVFYGGAGPYSGIFTETTSFCVDSNFAYTYDNGWSPTDPNGVATASDDILIASGNAIINTNTTCNNMTVNPGGGLTINSAVNLTTLNKLTLKSSSTSYSSLILDGSVTGTINYERHVNINGSGTTGSNDLISAPLTGQQFDDFAIANPNILNNGSLYLFGPFDKVTGDYLIFAGTEIITLNPGIGYRAASSDNGTFTFTGTANNGVITNNITNSGPTEAEWNLVGNPYPSYLNVQAFLNHEVSTGVKNINLMNTGTAAIYGYDGNAVDDWVIYNLANTTASTVIAPGQGFFVSANPTNVTLYDLEFTPAMRSTGTSDDFILGRSANSSNSVLSKLKLSNATKTTHTSIYFIEGTTRGLDSGYDAETYDGASVEFSIFTNLVEDNQGQDIAIQSLPYNDFNDVVVPIGINAIAGDILTIKLDDNSSLATHINVYLEDTLNNSLTLLNESEYRFTPMTDLFGTGRFFLRYTSEILSINTTNKNNELNISVNENSKRIIIKGILTDSTKIALFDIHGRLILSRKLDQSKFTNTIDVSSMSSGVYMIKVSHNHDVITKKLIIN
ncbi:M4 family metallopeptidase [Psychroserpens sp.]|uniref:M4 family metallopeptidase n=1 Tax=Psychroserpens sp. TaxID=2020870 RepID=UPI00385B7225